MPDEAWSDAMQFINQYSFLLLGLVMITILMVWRLREGFRSQDWVALAALAASSICLRVASGRPNEML